MHNLFSSPLGIQILADNFAQADGNEMQKVIVREVRARCNGDGFEQPVLAPTITDSRRSSRCLDVSFFIYFFQHEEADMGVRSGDWSQ